MRPSELFGLALRLLGLYLLVDAVPKLVTGVLDIDDFDPGYVARKAVGVVFGVYFLSGARGFQRFAYPAEGRDGSGGANA